MSINNYAQIRNTVYPAATDIPQVVLRSVDGIMEAYGNVLPIDGTTGYAVGAVFKHSDGGVDTAVYINEGSKTSCDFNPIDAVPTAYGTAAGRGPSPLIWNNCPVLDYMVNPELGSHFFDDFHDGIVNVSVATQSVAQSAALGTTGKWGSFKQGTAGTAITTLTTDIHGVVQLASTTDNEDACICYPKNGHTAGMFKFTPGKKLWMEARISFLIVSDDNDQSFIGFAEEGLMAAGTILAIDEAGMVDKDYVGFVNIEADGDMLDVIYNEEGGTDRVVNADLIQMTTANAFRKIGMYCDGQTITYYADGVALAGTTDLSDIEFPAGEEMTFYICLLCGDTAADQNLQVDWVRLAQEY